MTEQPGEPQPAACESIAVGDIRVTYLPDGEAHFVPGAMFPSTSETDWDVHRELLDSGERILVTMGGFLIETGDRKIVVDLGFGSAEVDIPDLVHGTGGGMLDSLGLAGFSPDDIDTVVFTHLHSDHTGWTTAGEHNTLTFQHARHVLAEAEWEHWNSVPAEGFAPAPDRVLAPLADRFESVADGATVAEGVNVLATPGHTPGHQSLVISSGTDRAILLGDVMHCPLQVSTPEWGVAFDVDPQAAQRTRDRMLADLEGSTTTVGCGHFPEAAFGRVLTGAGKRYWQAR